MGVRPNVVVALLCLAGLAVPLHANEAELSAQDVLARVAERYKNLRTYRDDITVTSRIGPGGTAARVTLAYASPDLLFLDVNTITGYRVVSLHDSQGPRTWTSKQGWRNERDLDGLLEGSIKGTDALLGSAAYRILTLLLPENTSRSSLSELTDLRRLPDAKAGGIECYRVDGKSDEDMRLWIDTGFLIRRIEVAGQYLTAEIDHKPSIDAPVTEADIRKLTQSAVR